MARAKVAYEVRKMEAEERTDQTRPVLAFLINLREEARSMHSRYKSRDRFLIGMSQIFNITDTEQFMRIYWDDWEYIKEKVYKL